MVSCLHLVRLFLFVVLLLSFVFFCFFSPLKKRTKSRTRQNPKNQNAEKGSIFVQLAQLCSQIVFLIFRVGLKMKMFAENAIK